MTALGPKAIKSSGEPSRITFRTTVQNCWSSSSALLTCEPDRPPRLSRKDLKDPERFHQRLVEWLLKQR
ncbi:MAG TPA: hypothetical protein VN436_18060 [Holophaga sp.]|nr:hypothetical protein [Holophaga sp.]